MPDWEREALADPALCTYRLHILVGRTRILDIGRLGRFRFPAGRYVYTGSARRNLVARVRRHLSREKRLRWHIDYLLAGHGVRVTAVELSRDPECEVNRASGGEVVVPGFGASDCREGCASHLRFLGPP